MANANTIYRAKKAATLTNPTSASNFVTSDDSTKAVVVYFPVLTSGTLSAAFRFRARGHATTAGSYNLTPAVYYGTSATAASNTSIAAASAQAIATTTASWIIEGTLYWDGTAKTLNGAYWALNGSTAVITAWAATTVVTSVDLTTAGNGLSVVNTLATGGSCYLDELTLEVL